MEIGQTLTTVETIVKIFSTLISLFAIIWSVVSVGRQFIEKMKVSIEQQDWEATLTTINDFVKAAEQAFVKEGSAGADKKQMVINLLEQAGYEMNDILNALIESAVYTNFNAGKEKE